MKLKSILFGISCCFLISSLPVYVHAADMPDDEAITNETTDVPVQSYEIQSIPDSVEANQSEVKDFSKKLDYDWNGQTLLKPTGENADTPDLP